MTLELSNVANLPITIYHGMKIGQISFMQMTEPAATPYGAGALGSKYQGQRGPTPSRYWKNFARDRTSEDPRHRRHGLRRARGRPRAARAGTRRARARARPERAQRLASWGAELATGDVTDPASLAAAVDGCTHVVHLVAIIRGRDRRLRARDDRAARSNVIAAAREAGVERFVLMSALGTSETTQELVPYWRAKWQMEQDVAASGLEHVILRPSFVFGKDGGVLPTFVRQVRYSPVVTVLGPGTARLQPIWVGDVAAHFARALYLAGRGRTARSSSAARTS